MAKKNSTRKKPMRLGHDPFDMPDEANSDKPNEKLQDENNDKILDLPPNFSISCVEEIYIAMNSILNEQAESIKIDAENVESVDTAAIQILHAFIEKANITGKQIHWKTRSEKIQKASEMLNINIT